MAITVQMIENKEFTTAPMGYKRKEVDMFLDEICDEMDRLNDEIQSLQIKLSQLSRVLTKLVLAICVVIFGVQLLRAGGFSLDVVLHSHPWHQQ